MAVAYSDGDSLTGASNAGCMKNRYFRPTSRFIIEMTQDMAIVTIERQKELVRDLSHCASSNDLSDLEWLSEILNDS